MLLNRSNDGAWESRVTAGKVELRDGPNGPMFVGYAFRYGVISENLGGFHERVRPGAATKTVQEQDLRALFNHEPNNLLGRMGAHTLRVGDDGSGLGYQIDQPNTSLGRDLAVLIARGDVYGSSFTFIPVGGARGQVWTKTETGRPLRELREIKMRDVGPVTFPAYPLNDVALRSFAEMRSLPFEEVIAAAADERLAELFEVETVTDGQAPRETHAKIRRYF
jgi:HK97 family phage prohead protease